MNDDAPPLQRGTLWTMVARWTGAAGLAAAVLLLELTGHASAGTFIDYVALPGLAYLGLHTTAKTLN